MSCACRSEQGMPLGVSSSCPNVFGGIFAAESTPSLTGVSWSLCLGHWGVTASEHSLVLCWILLPRLCRGVWASPGGRPAPRFSQL